VFVPRGAVGSVAVDRLLVPGAGGVPVSGGVAPEYPHARPGFAFDGVLTDVARHLDVATARFAAKSLEYPVDGLVLTGPSWPWALLLRVVALAAAGAALGLGLTRRLGRRRTALTAAERCRTVTG